MNETSLHDLFRPRCLRLAAFRSRRQPDVFLEGNAGPYKLFVTVRVPQVIPGVAEIEIRSESGDVTDIRIAPMQLTGPGSQYPPAPEAAARSKDDPQFFQGNLWLMEFGSLQVRIQADGAQGRDCWPCPFRRLRSACFPCSAR